MKRLGFALVLMLAIVSLLVAGCDGGEEEATPTPTATPGAAATATPEVTPTPTPETGEGLPGSYKYTMVFSSPDGSTGTYKVWVKDGKWRVEETVTEPSGEESTVIYICKEDHDYVIEDNTAIQYPSGSGMCAMGILEGSYPYSSDAGALAEARAECDDDPMCRSVDIVGHETIAGVRCTIVEGIAESPEGGEIRGTIWLVIDKGWLLKMERTTPEGTETMEFEELDLNPTIADSVFELPEGVEIIEWP